MGARAFVGVFLQHLEDEGAEGAAVELGEATGHVVEDAGHHVGFVLRGHFFNCACFFHVLHLLCQARYRVSPFPCPRLIDGASCDHFMYDAAKLPNITFFGVLCQ